MDALAEKLEAKLLTWKPDTAAQVRQRVAELSDLADDDVIDLMHSRARQQEVLDILDYGSPILDWRPRPARCIAR